MQALKIMNANSFIRGTTGICESFIPNPVYTQCVRWKRKPIWLPTAKSKVFRVPKRPVIPVEEQQELLRLHNNYKTYMNSLRALIRQIAKENEIQSDEAFLKQVKKEDFEACNAINDKWNAEVAKNREIRLAEERAIRKENILQKLLEREIRQEQWKEQIDKQIRKAKAEASTFITAENIDAAIEECLTTITNHNRALDLEGNWYEGKYPPTPTTEKKQAEQ